MLHVSSINRSDAATIRLTLMLLLLTYFMNLLYLLYTLGVLYIGIDPVHRRGPDATYIIICNFVLTPVHMCTRCCCRCTD